MRMSTTKVQNELFVFIKAYIRDHGGVGPSYDEMALGIGAASKNTIHRLLNTLEERGLLYRLKNHHRSIQILERGQETLTTAWHNASPHERTAFLQFLRSRGL